MKNPQFLQVHLILWKESLMRITKVSCNPTVPFLKLYPAANRFKMTSLIFSLLLFGIGCGVLTTEWYFGTPLALCCFSAALCVFLVVPKLFLVMGRERVLTVFNETRIFKPREETRFWRFPITAHLVPLRGSCCVELEIAYIERFPVLEIFIRGLNFSSPGNKKLLFSLKFDWDIDTARPLKVGQAPLSNRALYAIKSNNLSEEICEYVEEIIFAKVRNLADDQSDTTLDFSDIIFTHVVAALAGEQSSDKTSFISIKVSSLKAALQVEDEKPFLI